MNSKHLHFVSLAVLVFSLSLFANLNSYGQTQTYYNGTYFYTDEDCLGSPIQNSNNENITTFQDFIDTDDSDSLIINVKGIYVVSDTQTIDGASDYVMIKRWRHSTSFDRNSTTTFYDSLLVSVLANAELTLKNVVIDGGAVWSGVEDELLGRGVTNVGAFSGSYNECVSMISSSGVLNVEDGTILQNSENAYGDLSTLIGGGAVFISEEGKLNMSGGLIQNCTAARGGAIYNRGASSINGDAVIKSNGGGTFHGGGIYNGHNTLTIDGNVMICNNASVVTGGGIISAGTGTVIFAGGSLLNNRCSGTNSIGGGGFCTGTTGSKLIITGGLVSGNFSEKKGGGVFSRSAWLTILGGTIINNTASVEANDVYVKEDNRSQNVDGGSIQSVVGLSTKNTLEEDLFVDTVIIPNITECTSIDSISIVNGTIRYSYGYNDMRTDEDGNLFLWLPSSYVVEFVAAGNHEYFFTNGELMSVNIISEGGKLHSTIDSDSIAKVFSESPYVTITGSNESGWTIELAANLLLNNQIDVLSGQYTILGKDTTHSIIRNSGNRIFLVEGILNLGSSTATDTLILDGNSKSYNISPIDCWGTINIYDKTKIMNNVVTSNGSVAVRARATLNMHGGEITQNRAISGAAVFVMSEGTLNMSGGIISNNISTSAGTIRTLALGKVNLSGGKIVNNVVGTNGGAIDNLGSAYLNGVEITGNVCGSDGGAIYSGNDSIILSGKVVVKDNLKISTISGTRSGTLDTSANNIYLYSNLNVLISSALSSGSCVYVNAAVTNDEDDLVIAEAVGSYVISGTDKSYFRHDVSTYNEVFVLKDDKIVLSPSTLPIDLYQFSGVCSEDGIKLSWTTASELNNDFFVLERSIDGVTFEKAGIIDGSGTTNSMEEYTFTDVMFGGGSYYRLLQVDFDGSVTIHEVIYVACGQELRELQLSIYPNPVETTMFVSIEYANENVSDEDVIIDIYNALGIRVLTQVVTLGNSTNIVNVNLEDLPYGVYNVVARTNNEVQSRTMIKR